ncbi:MAG: hypothetical protein JWM32_616 [Verrucomicrobia bacterium]|nr:hypothetical protein [Verrucomicrobiota bacterium]
MILRGPQSRDVNALRKISLILAAALALAGSSRGAVGEAARVILLANRDDPDSLRIARHYAEVRQVPVENIVALSMPTTETISWSEFVATIWQPLQDELIRRQWIDAIQMDLRDETGRRKVAVSSHRISYLVTCRGVPLRIRHDPALYRATPPVTDNAIFQTNQSAVDSELSLLAATDRSINGYLANPLFQNDRPNSWQQNEVVRVSRLDGPTADEANALVDYAMEAERVGLIGRAYVDTGGIQPEGDEWLHAALGMIGALGFDTDVEETRATFGPDARFDAPALYFGWYTPNLNGPMAAPGFHFPPGAIAVHIHSDSATTLRSAENGWAGPLVARGVTATVGNVFEPYLQLLHRPQLLLRALAKGGSFGEAAYFALPALSWQSIAIGDPLYRPFARSIEEQWNGRAQLPPAMAGYVTLRRVHLLEIDQHDDEAGAMLDDSLKADPSLILQVAVAERRVHDHDSPGALRTLRSVPALTTFLPGELSVAREAAVILARSGNPMSAVKVYVNLLRSPELSASIRATWLKEAREYAGTIRDASAAAELTRELAEASAGAKK